MKEHINDNNGQQKREKHNKDIMIIIGLWNNAIKEQENTDGNNMDCCWWTTDPELELN